MLNGDMSELMKQAQVVQEKMEKAKKEMSNIEVLGESGAGLVQVVMYGCHDVRSVTIDPSVMTEEKEILEDLLVAAMNDAVRRLGQKQQERISEMSKQMGLPADFKMPL